MNKGKESPANLDPPESELRSVKISYSHGRFQQAILQSNAILREYPNSPTLNNILGGVYLSLKEFNKAIGCYKKALKTAPDNAIIHNNMGIALHQAGRLADALNSFQKAIKFKPDSIQAYNGKASVLRALRRLDEAKDCYKKLLRMSPKFFSAHFNLANLLKESQDLDGALLSYKKALDIKPSDAMTHFLLGNVLSELQEFTLAVASYEEAIRLKPSFIEAYNNKGNGLECAGDINAAINCYNGALMINPHYSPALINLANAQYQRGEPDLALSSYEKALTGDTADSTIYYDMANILYGQNLLDAAVRRYKQAIEIKPDYAWAHFHLGIALEKKDEIEEALVSYQAAINSADDFAEAFNNRGNILKILGKVEVAFESYKKAIQINPSLAEAHVNVGNFYLLRGEFKSAIKSYEQAIAINPQYADAFYNLGNALKDSGKTLESVESYKQAVELNNDFPDALNNMGNALGENGNLSAAVTIYARALEINPDLAMARAQKMYLQALMGDWKGLQDEEHWVSCLGITGQSVAPLSMFSFEDAPDRQCLRARLYSKNTFKQRSLGTFPVPAYKPARLRIGYFSADFHSHPVMYSIIKVLELHDRDEFDVHAYSYGIEKIDDMHIRVIAAVENFHDLRGVTDFDAASLARSHSIDIAVDLTGHTRNSRSGIFAHRAAPIQVNYLGFPGTMAASFMDSMISDRIIVPSELRLHYTENLIQMPGAYMATDNTREISEKAITRFEMGLPEDAFVFCCFNNSYKISQVEFDIWVRLLQKIDGSVLWLRKANQQFMENLYLEADKKSIDRSRLIFAERVPMDEHLARHQLADLFLDTFLYNAHTTALDALWVGLPVITKIGRSFCARTGASLLTAIGMPELITHTDKGYETLALELAKDPMRLAKIKEKLAENRLTKPLFDTERFTKNLELGYQKAYDRHFGCNATHDIFL